MSVKKLKLLLIEDNPGDARIVREYLKDIEGTTYDVTHIAGLKQLAAPKHNFDVILLDLHLTDSEPAHTFKAVHRKFPQSPIIVLTGLNDASMSLDMVRLGAQDYLLKDEVDSKFLDRAIRYAMERKRNQLKSARALVRSRNLRQRADTYQEESAHLKQLNEAKDLFLSIASHQLRTPATAVKQYLGMLLEGYAGTLTDTQQKHIAIAFESNERQLKIVNDLIRVARLDNSQVDLLKKPANISKIIEETINDQASVFSKRNQTVALSSNAKQPTISVDNHLIKMVFENIIENASKYSFDDSEISVAINDDGTHVHIVVEDRGIGIAPSDVENLFNKFSRAGEAVKHAPDGSGLGLYWAAEVVKLHGGNIQPTSVLGKGTKFTISLPY